MTDNPKRRAVRPTTGRIFKARLIGPAPTEEELKAAEASKQLLEDPFTSVAGYGGAIRKPVYSFEQLVTLAESHPVHGAALEQKSVDITSGPRLVPTCDDEEADDEQRQAIEAWLDELAEEHTLPELFQAMQLDHETLGWGILEVARGIDGKARKLYHVPAQTMRAHQDKRKLVQLRQGRQAWFKRWTAGDDKDEDKILVATGRKAPDGTSIDKVANEALVFVRPSRRSTWYGIPNYIAAIGHITLANAARDYNVQFFTNAREPRLIFIMSGTSEEAIDETMDELEQSLRTQHGEAHRNLILPVGEGVDVKIERITAIQNDLHFTRLMEVTERNILIAHRMPPDRIGSVVRGFLGGNVAQNINRVYKDAVVMPAQSVLKDRLNRFLRKEYARYADIDDPAKVMWEFDLEDLDLSDAQLDTNIVVLKVKHNLMTLNEGRVALGLGRRDEFGEMTLTEFLFEYGAPGAAMAASLASVGDVADNAAANARSFEALVARLDELDDQVEGLLVTGKVPEEG